MEFISLSLAREQAQREETERALEETERALKEREHALKERERALIETRQKSRIERPEPKPRGLGVFISYRRTDSRHFAGRIFDHLRREINEQEIFFDVTTIPYRC